MITIGNRKFYHAKICINGHVSDANLESLSKLNEFCGVCGRITITQCKNCNTSIRGWPYNPHIGIAMAFKPLNFCLSCGAQFPWTKAKIEAIKELIDFEIKLSDNDKKIMKKNIKDLIIETPRTGTASKKFKYGLTKMTKEVMPN